MTDGESSPPIVGAFAPARVLDDMSGASRIHMAERLSAAGFTHLLTEGRSIPDALEGEVLAGGLRLGGGVACFSDHSESLLATVDHLRPVGPSGSVRPPMEWYQGLIPTDKDYEDKLVEVCLDIVRRTAIDVFALDFIRWPIHWELELREGASVVDSSFDQTTLLRFRDEMDVDVPIDDPSAAACLLTSDLLDSWVTFKCRVINHVVERIATAVRNETEEVKLGAFVIPGDASQRRRFAGQDVAALSEHLDFLLPMTYHAILQRTTDWVSGLVSDLRTRASIPIVPVLQATAEPDVAGPNDWGDPFPSHEFGNALDAAIEAGGTGFAVFPAHGLDDERLAQVPLRSERARSSIG